MSKSFTDSVARVTIDSSLDLQSTGPVFFASIILIIIIKKENESELFLKWQTDTLSASGDLFAYFGVKL